MTDNTENTETAATTDKPKRTYNRKSNADKLADALALVAKLQVVEKRETMATNPGIIKVSGVRARMEEFAATDKRVRDGYGKSVLPGVEQIRKLQQEAEDLQIRLERAIAFLPVVPAMTAALDTYEQAILNGSEDVEFPELPEEFLEWTESEFERIARIEAAARAEKRDKRAAENASAENVGGDIAPDGEADGETTEVVESAEVTEGQPAS